jgi:hypothetical protein
LNVILKIKLNSEKWVWVISFGPVGNSEMGRRRRRRRRRKFVVPRPGATLSHLVKIIDRMCYGQKRQI